MADTLQTYTDQTWEKDVLGSPQPVLVDFWAEWCVPCKTLVPILEALAAELDGKLKVGKLNVEENDQVPFKYKITTLPTLMLFKNGQVSEQRIGLISKENLVKLVEPHVR
jgi:thioredoxin 1